MLGLGVLKGMWVTFYNFVTSYVTKERLTTVQYPEERVPYGERYRSFPFLVYDVTPENLRCTACEICAKECPPKCITIVRATDAQGKPLKQPKIFDIDLAVCMSCGICEEVCPFYSIYMDHEFEIAELDHSDGLLYSKEKLAKPAAYFMKIRPVDATRLAAEREKKQAAKAPAARPEPPAGAAPEGKTS